MEKSSFDQGIDDENQERNSQQSQTNKSYYGRLNNQRKDKGGEAATQTPQKK